MNRSPVLEVSQEHDVEAFDVATLFLYRVEVEQGLCGVMPCSISCVDQGNPNRIRSQLGRPLFGMPQGDDIGVCLYGPNRIGQRFALRGGGGVNLGHADGLPAQSQHR